MNPLLLRFDQFAASTLISVAWQAILLTIAAAVVLRLMPRLSAAARFTAWADVFVVLLLLPFAPPSHAAGSLTGFKVSPFWAVAAALLWVTLSLWRATQLVREVLRLKWIAGRAQPLLHSASPDAPAPGVRPAQLCLSPDVLRPSVIGFFHPRILIPQALYEHLSDAELEHILLHERQHLRRRDDWLNLLQKLGLVLFPLNPALLWVEHRLCFERELACDESVLAATNAPASYARSLVSLAEHTLLGRRLSLALGAWEQRSELSRRVHRILAVRAPALTTRSAAAALTMLCTGLLASAAVLSRAPRLISFTNPAPESFTAAANNPPTLEATANPYKSVPVSASLASRPTLVPAIMQSVPPRLTTLAPATIARSHRTATPGSLTTPSRRLLASYTAPTQTHPSRSRRLSPPAHSFAQPQYRTISVHSEPRRDAITHTAVWTTTSFGSPNVAPTIFFAVFDSPNGSPAYAAVPTPAGWLVLQL